MNTHINSLNRRLGEHLGLVCGGTLPRFAWKYAPDQARFVYAADNRTLLKRSWADAPAPAGGFLGKVWVLAEWRTSRAFDHFGFSDGVRVPFVREADYAPYLETALAQGVLPSDALTQNYIFALDQQLQKSAEHDPRSFENYMAEEKYTADRNKAQDSRDWLETARAGYDDHVGAFGNCAPGTRHGYLSFQNDETTKGL
jgi:hypothetical protein